MGCLEGKVILVTGGSSGIGRASALAFGREDAKVVVSARRDQEGRETSALIKTEGGDAVFVRGDVTVEADVKGLVDRAVETYGRLDCAFNNAGVISRGMPTAECTEEDWDNTIEINLKGVWRCMKYEIPQVLKADGGVIVNNASVGGIAGLQNFSAYTASKHGVVGLTRAAAIEYGPMGIRINALCPGYVLTPMNQKALEDPENRERVLNRQPIGRIGNPEEIANAAVWLCSDASSFMTGETMVVDGGYLAK